MKSSVKKVTITRLEGETSLCDINHEFKTFAAASSFMDSQMHTLPAAGYDKFNYSIAWENGFDYSGRMDAMHYSNEFFKVNSNKVNFLAKEYLEYLAKDTVLGSKVEARIYLDSVKFED